MILNIGLHDNLILILKFSHTIIDSASAETTTKLHEHDSGSATNGSATTIAFAFAGTVGFAVIFFSIVACVRSKRCMQRTVVESHCQLQTQSQPPSRPTNERILLIFCRRIFVRRSSVPPDMENVTSNPELNPYIPQTGRYAYDQDPVISVEPPPYTPVSPSVPPPPYSE
ncbi:hypothetical protein CHS0354_037795 [Potamilus streckersoni]|uniref:Uncharacterized protein n=1 Tax=Potamilus streckersoni TaxID=2493646 RepID=A0AAE0SMF9_9BIVA|nr:hypothetical protein CHS0354_037795 [Potamilus streckersoni]